MKTNKIILIAAAVLLTAAVFFVLYFYGKKDDSGGVKNQEKQITDSQKSFEEIIKNFDPVEEGTLLDEEGTSLISAGSEEYSIVYYAFDKSIFITIFKEPVDQIRINAEQELLRKFNISKEEACGLNVVLNTYVTDDLENYGLSFCPEGKPFPDKNRIKPL